VFEAPELRHAIFDIDLVGGLLVMLRNSFVRDSVMAVIMKNRKTSFFIEVVLGWDCEIVLQAVTY